jgi:hypothetical protein
LESSFIPIIPKSTLSSVKDGVAQIRFLVSIQRADIFVKVHRIRGGTFQEENEIEDQIWNNIQLICPYDQNRIEEMISVFFPEND